MIKTYIVVALVLLLTVGAAAQAKKGSNVKKVTRAVELSNLAIPEICGNAAWAEKYTYSGTVVKRQFADNAIWLNGVVINDANDERIFINIDEEHVSGLGSYVPRQLSTLLAKGQRVKIWVYECGHTLYAYRVKAF